MWTRTVTVGLVVQAARPHSCDLAPQIHSLQHTRKATLNVGGKICCTSLPTLPRMRSCHGRRECASAKSSVQFGRTKPLQQGKLWELSVTKNVLLGSIDSTRPFGMPWGCAKQKRCGMLSAWVALAKTASRECVGVALRWRRAKERPSAAGRHGVHARGRVWTPHAWAVLAGVAC
jgi:hypothetical protein